MDAICQLDQLARAVSHMRDLQFKNLRLPFWAEDPEMYDAQRRVDALVGRVIEGSCAPIPSHLAARLFTVPVSLQQFLAEYAVCRVWYVSVSSPAGREFSLNTDENDPDYCDGPDLLDTIPEDAMNLQGTVSRDDDGEYRWEVEGLQGSGVRDCVGSTVRNLAVWGSANTAPLEEVLPPLLLPSAYDVHFPSLDGEEPL
jgi:hypothetical protein